MEQNTKQKKPDWLELSDYMHTLQTFHRLSLMRQSSEVLASAGEMELLSRVALSEDPLTPLELSLTMKIKKSAVSRLLAALLEEGYLKKKPSSRDKRSFTLEITPKGRAYLDENYRIFLRPVSYLYEKMGAEEFYAFLSAMEKATALLREKEECH